MLRVLDVPVTPARLRVWECVPEWLLVYALRVLVDTTWFEIVAAKHANAARDEMRLLAMEFKDLARQASIPTPATDRLLAHL